MTPITETNPATLFSIRTAVIDSPNYPFKRFDTAVKLDQNEAPEDFPAHLKSLATSRLLEQQWNRYPDLNADSLRQTIASYEDWPVDGIVVTTGSNVLIGLMTQLAGMGKRVVTVAPNFPLYTLSANLLGAHLTEVPLRDDLTLDTEAIIKALQPGNTDSVAETGIICLPQPQAPSGTLIKEQELESVLQASGAWISVIDEAYYQFSGTNSKTLARQYPQTVLLRTFSKAWGLAGLRLGYALTSPAIARQLQKLVPAFALSIMQTVIAQVALENPEYVEERVKTIIEERQRVIDALTTHATWRVFPSATNFILIRTPDAEQAFEQLRAQGILARRQDSMHGLQGCIRVTIGTPTENDAFLRAAGLADGGYRQE